MKVENMICTELRAQPGQLVAAEWRPNVLTPYPAFWLELDHKSRMTLVSIVVDMREQLSVKSAPAILFALEEVTLLPLPAMRPGGHPMKVAFKNAEDDPELVFRVWIGDWFDLQEKADKLGTGAPF
jgi:hypothetical protein